MASYVRINVVVLCVTTEKKIRTKAWKLHRLRFCTKDTKELLTV